MGTAHIALSDLRGLPYLTLSPPALSLSYLYSLKKLIASQHLGFGVEDAELKIRYSCINYTIIQTLYDCKSNLRFDELVMKSGEFEWLLYLVLIIITSCEPDVRFFQHYSLVLYHKFVCNFVFFVGPPRV